MKPTPPLCRKLSLSLFVSLATAILATSPVAGLPISPTAEEVSSTESGVPSVSDTVSDVIPSVSDTASSATGTVSVTGVDATSGSGASVRERLTTGGGSQHTWGRTPSREAVTSPSIPRQALGRSDGGTFAATVGRIIRELATTGFALLGWVGMTVGLAVAGILLVRSGKRKRARRAQAG